jgi:hypothetical protein
VIPFFGFLVILTVVVGTIYFMLELHQRRTSNPTISSLPHSSINPQQALSADINHGSNLDVLPDLPLAPEAEPVPPVEGTADNRDNAVARGGKPTTQAAESNDLHPGETLHVDFSTQTRIRQLLSRARGDIYFRRLDNAEQKIAQADKALQRASGNTTSQEPADETKSIEQQIDGFRQCLQAIRGFWAQVRESSNQLRGGEQIQVGENTIAFVDAAGDFVVVRSQGRNIRFRFLNLPASLAIAMAESTNRADEPTWRIYKAAIYAAQPADEDAHNARALDLIRLSENDGHDCQGIRTFLDFDNVRFGLPPTRIPSSSENAVDDALQQFKSELNITNLDQVLDPRKTLERIWERLPDLDDSIQRVALLNLVSSLAVHNGDVVQALAAIDEIAIWSELDVIRAKTQTLAKFEIEDLNETNARLFVELAIQMVRRKSEAATTDRATKTILSGAKKLASKYEFTDLMPIVESF